MTSSRQSSVVLQRRKVVVVGDTECGKTSLIHSLLCHDWSGETYRPGTTLGHVHKRVVTQDNKQITLLLVDTAGQNDCNQLRSHAYEGADVVIICFSVDNPDSLEHVYDWLSEIHDHCGQVPIILVGTKKDLREETDVRATAKLIKQGPVKISEGQEMAAAIGAIGYYECSAKYKDGVSEVLLKVALAITRPIPKNSKKHRNRILQKLLRIWSS